MVALDEFSQTVKAHDLCCLRDYLCVAVVDCKVTLLTGTCQCSLVLHCKRLLEAFNIHFKQRWAPWTPLIDPNKALGRLCGVRARVHA